MSTEQIKKGKFLLTIIVTVILVIAISIFILSVISFSKNLEQAFMPLIFRLVFTIILSILMFKGHHWARWTISAILLLSSLSSIFIALQSNQLWNLLFGAILLILAIPLFLSKNITRFIQFTYDEYMNSPEPNKNDGIY
jgi:hypothetical protein